MATEGAFKCPQIALRRKSVVSADLMIAIVWATCWMLCSLRKVTSLVNYSGELNNNYEARLVSYFYAYPLIGYYYNLGMEITIHKQSDV